MECPLCESGTYCEVHDDMPTVPNDKGERVDVTAPGEYDDGMTITVQTYMNTVEITLPAEMCRVNPYEVTRLGEAMIELCVKDYEEKEAMDEQEAK